MTTVYKKTYIDHMTQFTERPNLFILLKKIYLNCIYPFPSTKKQIFFSSNKKNFSYENCLFYKPLVFSMLLPPAIFLNEENTF